MSLLSSNAYSRPFYDLSRRPSQPEFAASRRLRMHIDCNEASIYSGIPSGEGAATCHKIKMETLLRLL